MTFQPGLRADSAAQCYRRHPVVKALVRHGLARRRGYSFCSSRRLLANRPLGAVWQGDGPASPHPSGERESFLQHTFLQHRSCCDLGPEIFDHLVQLFPEALRWGAIRVCHNERPFNAASNVCQVHHFVPGQGSPAVYLPPIALDRVAVLRKDRLRPGQIKAKSLATDRWRVVVVP